MTEQAHPTHSTSQDPTSSETIRDICDASEATRAALDSVEFINREALTLAQIGMLASATRHLRAALVTLDALAGA